MKLSTTLLFGAASLIAPALGDALPAYLQMYALNKTNRAQIGCINGYGNFTTEEDCGIFRVVNNASGFGAIYGYAPCSAAGGVLDCWTNTKPLTTDFFGISSELYLPGTGFDYSIAAVGDGPLDPYGMFGWGVPLHIGDAASILLEIVVTSVTG